MLGAFRRRGFRGFGWARGRTQTFARDPLGVATNETLTVYDELSWTNRTASIDRPLDAFGRPAGLAVQIDGDFAQSLCYDYGMDGRMNTVTVTNAQGRSVSVGYDWSGGRLSGWTVSAATGELLFEQTFERDVWRPWNVNNAAAGGGAPSSPVRSFDYGCDLLGRPVSRNDDSFGYNPRGEVTSATISGATWGYAYDNIGNRETATAPSGTTAYAANALNQYTAVTDLSVAHDADGNMTRNGERNQIWDAAGRLVKSSPDLIQRWQTWQDFDYDCRGRRTAKYTRVFFGGTAQPVDTHLYFYDGWNLVHETKISENYQITHVDYFWGPDLSGSLQGAGGVGGLVAVSIGGQFYFPGYDNNGNVIGYWNEAGALVAEYAYDAFGNTIASSGAMAAVFPHRFSTKYFDSETGLYYYGYRYYSPILGRWISRDPMEEDGGLNICAFLSNQCLFCFDLFGLKTYLIHSIGDSMTYGIRQQNLTFNKIEMNSRANANLVGNQDYQGWRGYLKDKLDAWSEANQTKDIWFKFVGNHPESDVPGNVPHDGYPGIKASEYMDKVSPNLCGGGIYIVFLGYNDATAIANAAGRKKNFEQFMPGTEEGFAKILEAINNENPELLLLGKPPLNSRADVQGIRDGVNAVLQEHIYPLIDSLYDSWNPKNQRHGAVRVFQLMHTNVTVDDGFHYSIDGNRLLAERLFKEITDYVRGIPGF